MLPEILRSLSRISGAATDFPLQAQEILEDLRQGRLELRTKDSAQIAQYDLIGRRIYSGIVVGSLLAGSAFLVAANAFWTGALFFVMALAWGGGHSLLATWMGRKKKT